MLKNSQKCGKGRVNIFEKSLKFIKKERIGLKTINRLDNESKIKYENWAKRERLLKYIDNLMESELSISKV
jgi:hypothetical protein